MRATEMLPLLKLPAPPVAAQAGASVTSSFRRSSKRYHLPHLNDGRPLHKGFWPDWVINGHWPPARPLPRETPRGVASDNAISPRTRQLERLLWQAHRDIDRHVRRSSVPTFPFAGRPMRFQSEVAMLQIYADGRFTFMITEADPCIISVDADSAKAGNMGRRVITYEGACSTTDAAASKAQTSTAPHGAGDGPLTKHCHAAVGLALVCTEAEDVLGSPVLQAVTQRQFRFVFAISPLSIQDEAVVQPIFEGSAARIPGNAAHYPQTWHLSYVDARPQDADCKLRSAEASTRRRQRILQKQQARVLPGETTTSAKTENLRLPPI